MIEVTTKNYGRKIYINPFWIESVTNKNDTTRIFTITDDSCYEVVESVEEVIKKIEDDRR